MSESVFDEILDELRSGDKYDTLLAEKAAAELASLRARVTKLEAALREIAAGKTADDNDSLLGVYASMAGRFVTIAQDALKPAARAALAGE